MPSPFGPRFRPDGMVPIFPPDPNAAAAVQAEPPASDPGAAFFAGLDLGQAQDYTALAVLERTAPVELAPAGQAPLPPLGEGEVPAGQASAAAGAAAAPTRKPRRSAVHALRHLQRFPLGTSYPDVVDAVRTLFDGPLRGAFLIVDQTGVGLAVVNLLRKAGFRSRFVPVVITGGHKATREEDGSWHIPKKELVSNLQVVLQQRRLKVAKSLPEAPVLVKELQNFKVKLTAAANETFGAWRDGQHDDLVLATALAVWQAERTATVAYRASTAPIRTVADDVPRGIWD